MSNAIAMDYTVSPDDFSRAGEASSSVKQRLKRLGIPPPVIRRVAIALYEGEINMVIHANGGTIHVEIMPSYIKMVLSDTGPGILDIEQAMQAGWTTASDTARNLGFGAGMGLPNMKNNTDEMNIETVVGQGTVITMVVNI